MAVFFILFIVFLTLFLVYRDKSQIMSRRINTIKKGLDQLHDQKRINDVEYQEMMGVPAQKNNDSTAAQKLNLKEDDKARIPVSKSKDIAIQSVPTEHDKLSISLKDSSAPAEQADQITQEEQSVAQQSKKKFNGLNALMIVGVVFILLSGAIFMTTTWVILPAVVRLVVMCSFSALFFVTSVLADKALGIRKTSLAFYTIASVFLPITVIAAGFFNLFGNYLSISGEGRFFLYMLASIVLCVPCFVGAQKYRLTYFSEGFLYCISLSYVFFVWAFNPKPNVFVFLLLLYSAAWVLLGQWIYKNGGYPESIIIRRIPIFSMINALVSVIIGAIVLDMGWSGLMLIAFAPLFLTSLFNRKNVYWGSLPFAFVIVFGFGRLYTGTVFENHFWMQMISVFTLAAMSGLPSFSKKRRQWFSAIAFVCMIVLFSLSVSFLLIDFSWSISRLLLVVALLLTAIFIAYRNKEKYYLYSFPFLTIAIIFGVADLIKSEALPFNALVVLFSAVIFVLVMLLDKIMKWSPRTIVFDVFLTGFGALGVLFLSTSWVIIDIKGLLLVTVSFSILLGMLTYLTIDKKFNQQSVTGIFIPPAFFLGSIPIYTFFSKGMNAQFIFLIFFAIVALGSLLAFAQRKNYRALLEIEISCLITLLFSGTFVSMAFRSSTDVALFAPGAAWIWVIFLIGRIAQYSKEGGLSSYRKTRIFYSIVFVGSLYVAAMLTAYHWLQVSEIFWILLYPTSLALILYAMGLAFKIIKISVPVAFHYLPHVSTWSLSFLSAFLVIFFVQVELYAVIGIVYAILVLSLCIQYHFRRAYIFAWFELFLLYITSLVLLDRLGHFFDTQWLSIFIFGIQFFLMIGCGRLLHKYVFNVKASSSDFPGKRIDWLSLMSVFCPLILLTFDAHARHAGFILLFMYALTFFNRTRSKYGNHLSMTFAGIFAMFAIWFQPYFVIPARIVTEFNLIIFILYFVFLYRKVWKSRVSALLLYLSVCFSYVVLIIAAMMSRSIVDALIIGGSALVIIIVSFLKKRKRWFTLSFLVLLFLGFFITRGFWSSIAWWIYLLFVGFLLIGLAAANEVSKQKGEGLGKKASKYFDNWT